MAGNKFGGAIAARSGLALHPRGDTAAVALSFVGRKRLIKYLPLQAMLEDKFLALGQLTCGLAADHILSLKTLQRIIDRPPPTWSISKPGLTKLPRIVETKAI